MKIPITQSKEWQKLQDELGNTCYYEKNHDFAFLAIVENTPIGNYLYLPYGPICDNQSSFNKTIHELKNVSQKTNSFFIRIEPQNPKLKLNHLKKSHDLNPKETWILNLDGSNQDLLDKLPSRLYRYYKNATKNHLTIHTSNNPSDITKLTKLQNEFAKQKNIQTFSETYLRTELSQPFTTLYYIDYQNPETNQSETVAAGLIFDDKTTRYNIQGAQNEQGRKLHATGILTIQLILDAYKKQLKYFDFWGIAPENAPKNHPWAGFTNFKKTFKGEQVDYAGTHDLVLKPVKYRLYQFLRTINRILRRI